MWVATREYLFGHAIHSPPEGKIIAPSASKRLSRGPDG